MVALERGPFDLFERIRGWSFIHLSKESWLNDGINCPLCLSFWFGLIATAFRPFTTWVNFVFTWLALSGAATFLVKLEHD
jgi:hypothetical protein